MPHLKTLHEHFPRLKIVLEHATTRAAVEMVKSLGPTVGCSITAHHLELIVDDWAGQGFHFCKPVAKFPDDREALREIVREGVSFHAFPLLSTHIDIQDIHASSLGPIPPLIRLS